jgi:hypothetical protein
MHPDRPVLRLIRTGMGAGRNTRSVALTCGFVRGVWCLLNSERLSLEPQHAMVAAGKPRACQKLLGNGCQPS